MSQLKKDRKNKSINAHITLIPLFYLHGFPGLFKIISFCSDISLPCINSVNFSGVNFQWSSILVCIIWHFCLANLTCGAYVVHPGEIKITSMKKQKWTFFKQVGSTLLRAFSGKSTIYNSTYVGYLFYILLYKRCYFYSLKVCKYVFHH